MSPLRGWRLGRVIDPKADAVGLLRCRRSAAESINGRELTVRVPRYQIGALDVLAAEGGESVETLVTRVFEELAEVHQQRLAQVIPGLAEAMAWPDPQAG